MSEFPYHKKKSTLQKLILGVQIILKASEHGDKALAGLAKISDILYRYKVIEDIYVEEYSSTTQRYFDPKLLYIIFI
jgi:hypothetical protein